MAVYEVFSFPLLIRYKTNLCSTTTCFYIITTLLTVFCPLILIVYSQGCWKKIDFFHEQPDVSFKHKMLMVIETTSPSGLIFWSTYEDINSAINEAFLQVLPEIEHIEEDSNGDGKKDKLQMTIDVPLTTHKVVSVQILLIFDYKLYSYSDFQMECAAYVYHSSSLPGAEFSVIGDLTLFQKEPLKHSGTDFSYNISVIKGINIDTPQTNLENIVNEYRKRNITTAFTNMYPIWKTGHGENESFKINIIINYPAETVLYKVGLWQLLMGALVQYLAIYFVIFSLMHKIKKYVFQNHLFSTIVINPIKQNV